MENAVVVKDVSMQYNISNERVSSLKEGFLRAMKGQRSKREMFSALSEISLTVKKGDALGIIGENGCGKSTLLKIISGVLKPTKGSVLVHGLISPIIELGVGFDPDLSGRENVFLSGALLGFNRAFMRQKYYEIVEFAELEKFMDLPLKNYSSGMYARLGFSIATLVKPEILIVDEILAVGDYKFQEKCEKRIHQMLENGTTLILVSHAQAQVRRLCQNVLWLEHGKAKMYGPASQVLDQYQPENPI